MVNLINKHGGPVFPLVQNLTDAMVTMVQNSALPAQEKAAAIEQISEAAVGITLRDYYIAHAPAEPQNWFKPKMDFPCPNFLDWRDIKNSDLQKEVFECLQNERQAATAAAIEWLERAVVVSSERQMWIQDFNKKRYTQWPAAWADEMLNARLACSNSLKKPSCT